MELTFEFDVEIEDTYEVLRTIEFKEELSDKDVNRLIKSLCTGKYYFISEDESIEDIYYNIYDIAVQLEDQEEYEPFMNEIPRRLTDFRYPVELRKMYSKK